MYLAAHRSIWLPVMAHRGSRMRGNSMTKQIVTCKDLLFRSSLHLHLRQTQFAPYLSVSRNFFCVHCHSCVDVSGSFDCPRFASSLESHSSQRDPESLANRKLQPASSSPEESAGSTAVTIDKGLLSARRQPASSFRVAGGLSNIARPGQTITTRRLGSKESRTEDSTILIAYV